MPSVSLPLRLAARLCLVLGIAACDAVPPEDTCRPVAPDPVDLAQAGRLVGSFLDRTEGSAAAARFAAAYRLGDARQCGGVLDLVYLPVADAGESGFAGLPQRFRVESRRQQVTWAFGPG